MSRAKTFGGGGNKWGLAERETIERASPLSINIIGVRLENIHQPCLEGAHAEFASFFYSYTKKVRKTASASLILQNPCLLIVLDTIQQCFLYFLHWFPT
jgi:hypothetical protein